MKVPKGLAYLWTWFLEMRFGNEVINVSVIDAWQRVNKIELNAWEIDTIRRLDLARRAAD